MTPIELGYALLIGAFLAGSTLGAVLTGLIVARPLRNAVHREEARWLDAEHANARVTAAHRKTEARWVRALDDLRVARDERDAAWDELARLQADPLLRQRDAMKRGELVRGRKGRVMPRGEAWAGSGAASGSGTMDLVSDEPSRSDHVPARPSGMEQAR